MSDRTFDTFDLIEAALPVRVYQKDGFWICAGYGFDYMSEGDTRDEAIDHFRTGFRLTLQENGKRGQFWK